MFALILIGCAKCDESANTCDTLPRNAEFGSIFINGIVESAIMKLYEQNEISCTC